MPPHSNLVDFNLDLFEYEDDNSSTSSDLTLIKISQHSLVSAASKQQTKKAKSVCFHHYDDIGEIKHVDDFSEEEIDELWWSPQEQCDMRMTCLNLVGRFNAGDVMDREEMLGLEKHTKVVAKPAKRLRRAANAAVFRLQETEQVASSSAARTSLIAEFYEVSCVNSALKARLSALKLAWDVLLDTEISLSSLH